MEDLLAPTPRRTEIALLLWFSWVLSVAALVIAIGELELSDLALVACVAGAMSAPVFAATRAHGARSFMRRLAVGSFAPSVLLVGANCVLRGAENPRGLLMLFVVVALAAPVIGALLHAPTLLLLRSIRTRGVARHRGREALVVGAYGVASIAGLWHLTPGVFMATGHCSCEGPVLTHEAILAFILATTCVIALMTLAVTTRGFAWEANVRGRLRAILAGSLVGWKATPAAGETATRPRLAIDVVPPWLQLERVAEVDERAPYRAADLHGTLTLQIPAQVRPIGAAMVLNALLGVAALAMGSAVAYEAHRATAQARAHIEP